MRLRKKFLLGTLTTFIVTALLCSIFPTQAKAAFGEIENFLRRCSVSIVPSANNTYDLGSSARVWRNIYGASLVMSGTPERITGTTYGEYVDFSTLGDDYIQFGGSGGGDNTDLVIDLDGTEPRLFSNGDTNILIDEGLKLGGTGFLIGNTNADYISLATDDLIGLYGASGTDNTDLQFDVDGVMPVLYSSTDGEVGVDDDLVAYRDLITYGNRYRFEGSGYIEQQQSGYIDVVSALFRVNDGFSIGAAGTFVDTDATPDISGNTFWNTYTGILTITDFDAGATGTLQTGQTIVVVSKAAITYDVTSSGIVGGTTDIVTAAGDITTFIYNGTDWYVQSRIDQSDDLN